MDKNVLDPVFQLLDKYRAGEINPYELYTLRGAAMQVLSQSLTVDMAANAGVNLHGKAIQALERLRTVAKDLTPESSPHLKRVFVASFSPTGFEDLVEQVILAGGSLRGEVKKSGAYYIKYDQDSHGTSVEEISKDTLSWWDIPRIALFLDGADRILAGELWQGEFLRFYLEAGLGPFPPKGEGKVLNMPK